MRTVHKCFDIKTVVLLTKVERTTKFGGGCAGDK